MSNSSPGPEWHWDNREWWWWNGSEWVEAGVAPATPPPVPPPPPAPQAVAPPPVAGPPAYGAGPAAYTAAPAAPVMTQRRGLGGGGIAAIILAVVLVLVLIGGGLAFFISRQNSDVVTLETEPLNTSVAAFTPSVGTDTPVTPVPVQGVQTAPAATVGLFGGTLDNSSCNKAQLVSYLQANPDKAAVWAQAQGITAAQIPAFVQPLTPVLLRSDTTVTNHGIEGGKLTTFTSVLQAGTAVLVNQYGVPVVKCNCGNPLGPPPPSLKKVRYKGTTWPAFQPGSTTVIQSSSTVINNYTLTNITNNTTFVRPAGTDGTADTPSSTPAPANPIPTTPATPDPQPTYVQPQPTYTPPEPTYTEPEPEYGRGSQAISLVQEYYRTCAVAGGRGGEDVDSVIMAASYDASPVGTERGAYTVTVSDESGLFVYLVNVDHGTVTPTNEGALTVAEFCPGVYN